VILETTTEIGKMDIWRSNLMEVLPNGQQRWSKPENLSFNTRENEMSPFIHAGNTSLYFASDGLTGMGGYDLYHAHREGKTSWSKPENMGYPINTHGDEMGLIINARGDKAYFASDREDGQGRDIFQFSLPDNLQPVQVSYLKGRLFDALTNVNLKADVELVDLQSLDTIAILQSDQITGGYLVCLPAGKEYAFNAGAPGYLFHSEHFSMKEGEGVMDPQHLDIGLKPIREGETVVLHNVFFDTDSWELKPESRVELKKLALFLRKQSRIRIEIGGHTDSTGSRDYNIELSRNRARSVYEFLLSLGIGEDQLSFKGYGDTKAIAPNDTEEGKARNRRTEFKILGK
jgi:outer membrane protein OmpA-like peptidoglycan-associated protein